MKNISVCALLLVSSIFIGSCSFLKTVPPDFPDGYDCLLIWKEIKDESGTIDKLKSFEASYGSCSRVREPEKKVLVPLETIVKENYVGRALPYEIELGKWVDKAHSRLKHCAEEGTPTP